MKNLNRTKKITVAVVMGFLVYGSQAFADSNSSLDILKQGLLGAGTGAISSGVSGGNAGKGALIGAGTNVIGGALLGFLTGPSNSGQQTVYAQPAYSAPQPMVQAVYRQPELVYAQPMVAYSQPQPDSNTNVIKQGLLGAGTGAIAAGASGGNAGHGALIGAGTNVIGGALLDMLTGPSTTQQPMYYPSPVSTASVSSNAAQVNQTPQKHIIRKFNTDGKVISEEEIWQ